MKIYNIINEKLIITLTAKFFFALRSNADMTVPKAPLPITLLN